MPTMSIADALKTGINEHQNRNYKAADKYYTAVLDVQPDNQDANHNMGVLAMDVNQVDQSIPFLEKAIKLNPKVAQFWISLVRARVIQGQIDTAKTLIEKAVVSGIDRSAFIYFSKSLEMEIETTKENYDSHNDVITLRDNGHLDQAIELAEGKFQNTKDTELLVIIAHCLILKNDLDEAEKVLQTAGDVGASQQSVAWNKARLSLKKGNVDFALKTVQEALIMSPNDIDGMTMLGTCLKASGKYNEAVAIFDRVLEIKPNQPESLIHRGLINANNKENVSALRDLEKAHKLRSHIKEIWPPLARLYLQQNDFQNAQKVYQMLTEAFPTQADYFYLLGICEQNLGNHDLAIMKFKRTLELREKFSEAYNALGVSYQIKGLNEDAKENFISAIKLNREYLEAYNNLAIALYNLGDLDGALEYTNRALGIDPDNETSKKLLEATLKKT